MQKLTYVFIIILFFVICCTQTNNEKLEWNKIKNEKDFSAFFNFALETEDSLLFDYCIDSLEKYKPENSCFILKYYDYYQESTDSVYFSEFYLYDNCKYQAHIKSRNIVFVNIDKKNSIEIEYSDSSYSDNYNIISTLFDTTGDSYDLPEYFISIFEKKQYISRKFGTIISCEMSPDTLNERSIWKTLIKTNKQVLEEYKKVREYKSEKIFSLEFNELSESERELIINMVPIFLDDYLYFSFINIPPPPKADVIKDRSE